MTKRVVRVGLMGVGASVAALSCTTFVACSSGSSGREVLVSSSSNPANVVIDLRNESGQSIGSCSGILISSSAVLTAGHCVVAAKGWHITSQDGKQTANGAQVFTTWKDFDSTWTHPLHSDVAVILLDQAIFVSRYPSLAQTALPDDTRLSRVRRVDPSTTDATTRFEEVSEPVDEGKAMGFPLAYASDAWLDEGTTDTGGAVYDPTTNEVYGVVSGKGLTTGRFYSSRVDYLVPWIAAIGECPPPPQTTQSVVVDCEPSSSGGSTSSSSSSGSSGCSSGSCSGSSSSGSSGCSSGSCSGSSGSGSGSSGSSSGSGSSSSGSSSSSSSSSSSGGSSSGGGGGGCNPGNPPQPPTGSDGGSSSGSSGGGSTSSSSGSTGGSTSSSSGSWGGGSTSSSGSSGSGSTSGSGSSSGSQTASSSSGAGNGIIPLIPDGPGCANSLCGGCVDDPACSDNQQDYGGCGCIPTNPPEREAGPNN